MEGGILLLVMLMLGMVLQVYLLGKTTPKQLLWHAFLWFLASIGAFLLTAVIHPLGVSAIILLGGFLLLALPYKDWNKKSILALTLKINIYVLVGIYLFGLFGLLVAHSLRFPHHKARQSEAKTNLSSIATAEISNFAEKNFWSDSFEVIQWAPEGAHKYSYFLSADFDKGILSPLHVDVELRDDSSCEREYKNNFFGFPLSNEESFLTYRKKNPISYSLREAFDATVQITGIGASPAGFTAIAIGNIDADPTLDVWAIGTDKYPKNIVNDVIDVYYYQSHPDNEQPESYFLFEIAYDKITFWLDRIAWLVALMSYAALLILRLKTPRVA